MDTTTKVTLQSIMYPTMMYLSIDSVTGKLVFATSPFVWDCSVSKVDTVLHITTAVISYTDKDGKVLSLQPDYDNPTGPVTFPAIVVKDKSQVRLKLTRQLNDDLDNIFSINAAEYEGDLTRFNLKWQKNDVTQVVFGGGDNVWLISNV
ncbi:hypothetical protein ACB496_15250 [Lelliottia nimipressuralis]|uniref:hypothetical protein n=1 Tax=Lelliottia nimipressuralis TaxID=69220 RepID=UPI0035583E0A